MVRHKIDSSLGQQIWPCLLVPVDEEEGVLQDEDVDEDNGEAIAAFLSSVFAAFFSLSSVSLEVGEGDMVGKGKAAQFAKFRGVFKRLF